MKKIFLVVMVAGLLSLGATEGSKDGLIVGVDWSLGQGVGSAEAKFKLEMANKPIGNGDDTGLFKNSTLTNSLKLFLGFQRYSAQNPALGFNIKAKLGAGLAMMDSVMKSWESSGVSVLPPQGTEKATSLQIPLTLGVETNFLYDFFKRGAHTLGLNVGLGVEVAYSKAAQANIRSDFGLASFLLKEAFERNGMSYALLSPKVGLHYYYGRHQFGMDMSFDKVLNKSFFSVQVESPDPDLILDESLSTKLNYFFTLGFNYAYRF